MTCLSCIGKHDAQLAGVLQNEFGVRWLRLTLRKPGAVPAARAVGVKIERGSTATVPSCPNGQLLPRNKGSPALWTEMISDYSCELLVQGRPPFFREFGETASFI